VQFTGFHEVIPRIESPTPTSKWLGSRATDYTDNTDRVVR
jgi:hypothetical protein